MKPLSTRALLTVLLALGSLLFGLFWLAYARLQAVMRHTEGLEQANRILSKTEEIFSLLKDAEAGQRGFMLTRDGSFLRPYQRAGDSLFFKLAQLDKLIDADDRAQREAFRLLDSFSHVRMQMLHENMRYQYQVRVGTDSLIQKIKLGADAMNRVRAEVGSIRTREALQLAVTAERRSQLWSVTPSSLIIAFTLAIGFFVGACLVLMREVVRRRRYGVQLEETVHELQRSNRELETFAYVASHDLQEPLRKLRTFSDRLSTRYGARLDGDAGFLLQRIGESAERMQLLIDDLLAFSRLIGPENKANFTSVSLDAVIDRVLDDFSPTLSERQAVVERPGELPAIPGNRVQLEQLFANLLSNSLKFSQPGVQPHVRIALASEKAYYIRGANRSENDAGFYQITFSDNGIGFDENFKEKIFLLFQRLHDRSVYEGSGIGLSLCRKIVELHGGVIDVHSKPGEGTVFFIYLPAGAV